jgi:peptidoglycan hydrolase-like protein with peptidoglycan-binding domain
MKKYINNFALVLFLLAFTPFVTSAENVQFNVSLGYGSTQKAEVIKLQNFLIGQGLLQSSSATGNYLSLTQKAVANFQTAQGIDPIGTFGPLTRAAANKIVLTQGASAKPTATISSVSVESSNSGAATALLSNEKIIKWRTSGYPAGVGVNINLIKKVSDSPKAYKLVRVIAVDTSNDGQENWTPTSTETGSDLYIEITCSSTYHFTQGCRVTGDPIKVN